MLKETDISGFTRPLKWPFLMNPFKMMPTGSFSGWIPPDSIIVFLTPLLFQKYITLNKNKFEYSKGLGLFFCKVAIENHNGRIWVESDDKGNYFYLGFKNNS